MKPNLIYSKIFLLFKMNYIMGIGDWGLGIGDWGLGIGRTPQTPIPNPQSPIPNPQSPIPIGISLNDLINKLFKNKMIKLYLLYFEI